MADAKGRTDLFELMQRRNPGNFPHLFIQLSFNKVPGFSVVNEVSGYGAVAHFLPLQPLNQAV